VFEPWWLLAHGFQVALTGPNILAVTVGVLVGTLTGVLPGIGPTGAMALLLPLSFGLDATTGIIMVAGVYYGAMYGGSITSILVNIPGEAASVVTCLDGYQMARQGRAGAALTISAVGSFVAGTVGLVALTLFAPPLARAALAFGPPEFFAIGVLGLIILSNLTGRPFLESALMLLLGLALGTIGTDVLTSAIRFTMGIDELQRGLDFPILAMGLFGLAEVFGVLTQPEEKVDTLRVGWAQMYPTRDEMRRSVGPVGRGTVLGFLIGLIPGPAVVISSFLSYRLERWWSKRSAEFGRGAVEGVAGPESANNSATCGAMVPMLALGLAFSPATALLLSVLMVHGIAPGPVLMKQHPDLIWGFMASMYVGNFFLLVLNLPLVGLFTSVLKVPTKILMPIITVITLTGAYALNNSVFDLVMVVVFGLFGFLLRKWGFDGTPLAVGLVIGPTVEEGLRQGLTITDGSLVSFIQRPVCGALLAAGGVILLAAFAMHLVRRRASHRPPQADGSAA